jgi:putative resolvase
MKSKDVLKLLDVTRVTLNSYVKLNKIKVTRLSNGFYDYDDESIYKFMKKDIRTNVIYARVSTNKQKKDLDNQIKFLNEYCEKKSITISKIYFEVASGIDFDRNEFSQLIDDVIHYKIKNIFISHKDRLTRLSFSTLDNIFKKFGTSITIIGEDNDKNNDSEMFEELVSLIHIFSTKMYSDRRKQKMKILSEDLSLFNE